MRLADSAHTSRPWKIHDLVPDFRVEDVWELPGSGAPGDFPRLIEGFAAADPAQAPSRAVRALFAIRSKAGALLGWDADEAGLDSRVATLRERLPAELRDSPGPDLEELPFTPLYMTEDEWAAEIANRTMHGVIHIGRIANGDRRVHAQMAILVKPNGLLGDAYMAAIRPFRHRIIYPAMLERIGRQWPRSAR